MSERAQSSNMPAGPAIITVTGSDAMHADTAEIETLHRKAERCRRLAMTVGDRTTVETLIAMAQEYEDQAMRAETSH